MPDELDRSIFIYFILFFQFLSSSSPSFFKENSKVLFCPEVPEMFCRLRLHPALHQHKDEELLTEFLFSG